MMDDMTMHNHDAGMTMADGVQDLTGGGSVTLQDAIDSQAADAAHAAMMAHMGSDDGMVTDHTALLELMPDASDPDVAVALNGGSWFDPNTWSTGEVPKSGQSVFIPSGVSVVYDGVSDARLDTVGVDGELHFAVDVDTRIVVDTLITNSKSVFTIGTEDNPVQTGVSAEIIIHRDLGPADDAEQLSHGVVTHGTTRIAGQDKLDHLKASDDPEAGDDFLIFEENPYGWQVGDKLVVAGTVLVGANEFQDEVVTIKSIEKLSDGSYKVNLNQTLQYDHIPPEVSTGEDLQVSVANFTRNVFIGTETDGDQYLSDGKTVPIEERGHVMFMHNDDVSVQNAEFFELGRTNKDLVEDSETNVPGRYALHFHRTGGSLADGDEPALAEGNAVWGSPGWGIVHHDANLDVISNAVYGVNGGAIIAEAGNETGKWHNNITINTTGNYTTFNSEHSGDPDHPAGRQQLLDDSFSQGIGFGFKSRLIETTDNVAISSNGAGYSFWPMGTEGGSASHINSEADDYEALYGYDPFFGQDDVRPSTVPNRAFSGNEVSVAHVGFNTSADKKPSKTDLTTVIEDLTAWEVTQGLGGFYQRDYLIKDSLFVGIQGEMTGQHVNNPGGQITVGISARELHEFKLVNNHFENFDYGIWEQSHETEEEWVHVVLGNTFTDVDVESALDIDKAGDGSNHLVYDNSSDWENSVDLGRLNASIDYGASDLVMTEFYDRFSVVVDKTDSLGSVELVMGSEKTRNGGASQKTWWAENAASNGYYYDGGKYYLVIDIAVSDRVTGTAGFMQTAIELAFVDGADDLPAGAVNNGSLPSDLGTFEIVDLRSIGESGNLLLSEEDEVEHTHEDATTDGSSSSGGTKGNLGDSTDDTAEESSDNDMGHDHDMGADDGASEEVTTPEEDVVEEEAAASEGEEQTAGEVSSEASKPEFDDSTGETVAEEVVEEDVAEAPAAPDLGDNVVVFAAADGFELNGSTHSVVAADHDPLLEQATNTAVSLTFNADTVKGIRGIFSKDADGRQLDGDSQVSAYIKKGTLKVVFENGEELLSFEAAGIEADQDYSLEVYFGEDGVSAYLDDQLIGADDTFVMSLEGNTDDILFGATSGTSPKEPDAYRRVFDGTIDDIEIAVSDTSLFDDVA